MHPRMFKPKVFMLVPVFLLLALAVACGSEATPISQPTATPQPTPTPIDVSGIVSKAVEEALTAAVEPLTAEEIQGIVKAAIPATPTPAATPTPQPTMDARNLAIAARYGGMIPMSGFNDPGGWDPHSAPNNHSLHAISPMYNQMLEYNPLNPREIIGDLAESWEVSDDGMSYTFTLRKGVKWHDGQDLTIDDVVFSINRIIDPDEPRPRAGRLKPYVASAEKVDENTVAIQMNFPSLAFLRFFALDYMKIVPQHVIEAGTDINVFENVVGSGPFTGANYDQPTNYEFSRNPNYFKEGRPYLDEIKVYLITDKGTEIAAFRTEQVLMNISGVNHLDVDDLVKLENDEAFSNKFDVFWIKAGSGQHVMLNVTKEPYSDPRVRRAVFLALDRQALVEGFGLGRWFIGTPMGPGNPLTLPDDELLQIPGYRQLDDKKHPADIEEARKLLADAGFPNGFKATFTVPIAEYIPDAAPVIVEQYKKNLNIDLELKILPIGGWVTAMIARDYDFAVSGYGSMVDDPDDRFAAIYLESGRNWSSWSDPKITEMFQQVQRELDPAKRRELAYEMQRVLLNEGTTAMSEFIHKPSGIVVSKRVKTSNGGFSTPWEGQGKILKHEHEWLEPN